jgi:hypothetical protein
MNGTLRPTMKRLQWLAAMVAAAVVGRNLARAIHEPSRAAAAFLLGGTVASIQPLHLALIFLNTFKPLSHILA